MTIIQAPTLVDADGLLSPLPDWLLLVALGAGAVLGLGIAAALAYDQAQRDRRVTAAYLAALADQAARVRDERGMAGGRYGWLGIAFLVLGTLRWLFGSGVLNGGGPS